MLIRVSLTQIW